MTIYVLEETLPGFIDFERVTGKDGQHYYVAYFQSKDEECCVADLQVRFNRSILVPIRVLLNLPLDMPSCREPDDRCSRTYLEFTLTQQHHDIYSENKKPFKPKVVLWAYYCFFHRYELPGDRCVYAQRIADNDNKAVIRKVVATFNRHRETNKKLFNNHLPQASSPLFSFVENNTECFIIANCVKTEEDYRCWIEFAKEVYKLPGMCHKLPRNFFSEEHVTLMQQAVDQDFASRKIDFIQLIEGGGKYLRMIDDFKWNPESQRYELPVRVKNSRKFYRERIQMVKCISTYGIPCYVEAEKDGLLFLTQKNGEFCKSRVREFMLLRLCEGKSLFGSLVFTQYTLRNRQNIYLHVAKNPRMIERLNALLDGQYATAFKYKGFFLVALSSDGYDKLSQHPRYVGPSEKEVDGHNSVLNSLTEQKDFFVPLFPDLMNYLLRSGASQFGDLLQKLLDFFDRTEACDFAEEDDSKEDLGIAISRFLSDIAETLSLAEDSFDYRSVESLLTLVNEQLTRVKTTVDILRYYECLQILFKSSKSLVGRLFSFYVDFDTNRIVYRKHNSSDGLIFLFQENGCYRCAINKEVFKKPPVDTDRKENRKIYVEQASLKRSFLKNLFKLLVAIVHANALLAQEQQSEEYGSFKLIEFSAVAPVVPPSEQYHQIVDFLLAEQVGIVFAEDVYKTTLKGLEVQRSAQSYERHIVIADQLGANIGKGFYLLAGDEELVIPKGTILTYFGQGLVIPVITAKKLLTEKKIREADLIELEPGAMIMNGCQVIWRNTEWIKELGAAQYINHTPSRDVNVRFVFLDGPGRLPGGGVVVETIKEIRIPPHRVGTILTSYGKDKERLARLHGIPVDSEPLLAGYDFSITQLTGIVRIDQALEKTALDHDCDQVKGETRKRPLEADLDSPKQDSVRHASSTALILRNSDMPSSGLPQGGTLQTLCEHPKQQSPMPMQVDANMPSLFSSGSLGACSKKVINREETPSFYVGKKTR